jgi:hypothetical protein
LRSDHSHDASASSQSRSGYDSVAGTAISDEHSR